MTKRYTLTLIVGLMLLSLPLCAQQFEKKNINAQGDVTFAQIDTKKSAVPLNQATQLLRNTLNMSASDELRKIKADADGLGFTHERYEQYYKGIRVEYGAYFLHAKDGQVRSLNGAFHRLPEISTAATLSESHALNAALAYVGASVYKWQLPAEEAWLKQERNQLNATFYPKAELVICKNYVRNDNSYALAFRFDIYAHEPVSRSYVYVDAHTGEVIHEEKIIKHAHATGTAHTRYSGQRSVTTTYSGGTYQLQETTRGRGIQTFNMLRGTHYNSAIGFSDNDNQWQEYDNANKDHVALDAHWGAQVTYDYWKNMHNRNSFDNAGTLIKNYVHYGTNYENAFWNGFYLTFGDGGANFSALTSLDIIAHEFGHAICDFTAKLQYKDEPGALNEGLSDIWGACVEYYAAPEKDTWLIGEEINLRSGHSAIRSMEDPKLEGQPDTYKGINWYTGSADNGGIHKNSGVLNHWFYILAMGKSGINDLGNKYSIDGIGISKAARIVYRTESIYLSSNSNYADMRDYSIQSAIDLFGENSPEATATHNAWFAVGIGSVLLPPSGSPAPVPGISYCASNARDGLSEWIKRVHLGLLDNLSGSSSTGYKDYTALHATLVKGSTATIRLEGSSTQYLPHWCVWIDWNADGDFLDANEQVVSASPTVLGHQTYSFSVPAHATAATTRMRVSMKRNRKPNQQNGSALPTSCESFSNGEVEDYSIRIELNGTGGRLDEITGVKEENTAMLTHLYPNPAADNIHLHVAHWEEGVSISIVNMLGAEVYSRTLVNDLTQIDIAHLPGGMYLLYLHGQKGTHSYKFMKR